MTPIMRPRPDAAAKSGFDGLMVDEQATATAEFIKWLEEHKKQLRDTPDVYPVRGHAEWKNDLLKEVFFRFAHLVNAIVDECEGLGFRVGSQFDPDPSQHDIYVKEVE